MKQTIHLAQLNTKGRQWGLAVLEKDELTQRLPELYALHGLVEQNDWHNDDPFQQSRRLFDWIKELPASLLATNDRLAPSLCSLLTTVVDPDHDHYTIHDLLAFTALIHDVGKAATYQRLADGTTRCPDHEAVGARMAAVICSRFAFSPVETSFITTLVAMHGMPYTRLKAITASSTTEEQKLRDFEAEHAGYLLPLLLLAYGDLATSHLQARNPEKYATVSAFYQTWLQSIWEKVKIEEIES